VTAIVRLLTVDDAALLGAAETDVFDDPVIPASAAAFLADPRHLMAAAIDEGRIVGFASAVLYLHPDKAQPELWINEAGVAETHQRRGLARALIAVLKDEARARGATLAWVLTNRDNSAARAAYKSAGGREAADDVVMVEFDLSDPTGAVRPSEQRGHGIRQRPRPPQRRG
jgi:aminoglycoside 6'-N-acetyltransferase I